MSISNDHREALTESVEPFGPSGDDTRRRLLAGTPVNERRLHLAGVSTAVLEAGAGPPLVLLHGPGAYGAAWLSVFPALAATYHVIAPDLPGQGASTVDTGALDADRVLSWLGALIEETCPSPPAVVGQLFGGALAARFAAGSSGTFSRLVLVVPFGLTEFRPSPEFVAVLRGFTTAPSSESHDDLWRMCVRDLDGLRGRLGARWDRMKAYTLDLALTPSVAGAQLTLMEEFGMPAVPPEVLSRVTVPTALIWGRHDTIVRLSVGEAASARYGWPLHVIDDAGNEPALESPEAFLRALDATLGATEPSAEQPKEGS